MSEAERCARCGEIEDRHDPEGWVLSPTGKTVDCPAFVPPKEA